MEQFHRLITGQSAEQSSAEAAASLFWYILVLGYYQNRGHKLSDVIS